MTLEVMGYIPDDEAKQPKRTLFSTGPIFLYLFARPLLPPGVSILKLGIYDKTYIAVIACLPPTTSRSFEEKSAGFFFYGSNIVEAGTTNFTTLCVVLVPCPR